MLRSIRNKKQSLSQRRTIALATVFVVFVCLSLLTVNLVLAWQTRQQELRQAITSNTNLAAAVAQQVDGFFSEIGHVLDNVAFEWDSSATTLQGLDHLRLVLQHHAKSNRQLHGLFVHDARGNLIIDTADAIAANANNADCFLWHRDDPSLALRVGQPIVNRATNMWIIPISRRLNDASGRFAGVVLATVDMAHIQALLANFDIGQQGSLTLALSDGMVLVRRPFAVENLGKTIAGSTLQHEFMARQAGAFEAISPIDGVVRIGSFQHIPTHALLVTVALSKREVLSHWRQITRWQSAWIVLLCAVTALAGSFMVRSIRQRMQIERHLRKTRDELSRANKRLAKLASYDGLTGLGNRRFFDEMLERAFAESCRSGRPLGLVMIDVDHFKQYNDLYGHPAGDRCLQMVAQGVQSAARRPLDFVARYGGEEIVMMLPDTDGEGAAVVAEAARAAVEDLRLPHDKGVGHRVSISVGAAVTTLNCASNDARELVLWADAALYRAKQAGRNTVVIHDVADMA